MSVNKVILVGRLGAEPESKAFPNGGSVCNLRLATSQSWKDKSTGERQERTEWHRVSIFGKLAEVAQQYLHKGSQVYIEGQIQTRKWQDQSGQDRYTTEVVVNGFGGSMTMLGGKGDGQQSQQPVNNQPQPAAPQAGPGYGSDPTQSGAVDRGYEDDDFPF